MEIDDLMERENTICEAIYQIESGFNALKSLGLFDMEEAIRERERLADAIGKYWDEEEKYLRRDTDSLFRL